MKRTLFFALLSITSSPFCHAQGSSYTFSRSTAPYTVLAGDSVIPSTAFVNGFYNLSLQGDLFRFYKTPFPMGGVKTFAVQPNGNLRVDNDSALIIIDGAFTYLDSIDAASAVSFKIEGSPGNKVVKAQWKNLNVRVGQAGNFMNMQIWVYQLTGVVEIRYGASSASNRTGFNATSGPQVGMFFSRDDFTKCFDKLWITGPVANPVQDSGTNYNFFAMQGIPDSGTVYRFSPRFSMGLSSPLLHRNAFHVFPNPVQDGVIRTSRVDDYILYDALGRVAQAVHQTDIMRVQDVQAGVYYLRSGSGYSQRIIIP